MRRERGYVQELPDLAVWIPRHEAPGAVIAEHGGRREDRQKMILEGWRDAVRSGQYTAVRYDCASPSVAHWIARLARKVGLTDREFKAYEQTTAEHILAMPSAVPDDDPPPSRPSHQMNASRHRNSRPKRLHPFKCQHRPYRYNPTAHSPAA